MHFAIRFLTEYHYDGPVTDNLNALRVRPATTSTQRCDEFHTRIEPEARVSRHLDYFGTEVLEFGIPTSHDHLTIDVRARVVTSDPPEPPEGSWDSLGSPAYVDAAGEFALPWQDQPAIAGIDDLYGGLDCATPLETLQLLCELIPDRFEYRPGATYVGSTITDLLESRAGVCQDFVHLSLVLLRRRGIAARYVSGYLHPSASAEPGTTAIGQSHAWVEYWAGSWTALDPTSGADVGERHVVVARGRDYTDVPPLKGLYHGSPRSDMTVTVEVTRLA